MSKAKIIASSALVLAMVFATVGTSVALFSDQKSVQGNTVAMGTLELTLNKSSGKPISVTNAYPGWKMADWEYMDIYNTGSLPFTAHLSFLKTSGSTDLYNYLTIELRIPTTSDCDGPYTAVYNGLVKDFVPQTHLIWHHGATVPAGWSMRLCQKVGVHADADNSVMGESVTFDEIVDAMQAL